MAATEAQDHQESSNSREVDRVLSLLGGHLSRRRVGDGYEDPVLLFLQRRISLEELKAWFTNEPIALASELTTAGVLVAMSVTSLLHKFSKPRSVAVASSEAQPVKGGSVSPMCSYCLAIGTEEETLHHDRDCPWNRERNRCRRCGYVTWWDEFVSAEHCACHAEGKTPDV